MLLVSSKLEVLWVLEIAVQVEVDSYNVLYIEETLGG